jgi:hypothetical protein
MADFDNVFMDALRKSLRDRIAGSSRGSGKSKDQVRDMAAKEAKAMASSLSMAELQHAMADGFNHS